MHQNYNLFPDMTIEQNLLVSSRSTRRRAETLGEIEHRRWRGRVNRLFERLGVQLDPGRRVNALGPAQRKFVEIARATILEPSFLILDEPTAALEPGAAQRVLDLLRTLRGHGVGLLLVSHRLDEVHRLPTESRFFAMDDSSRRGQSLG